ncbi:chaperone [Pseudomonas sp. LS-2]|nr:chaperone [Pseudomonas sp. LS-2]
MSQTPLDRAIAEAGSGAALAKIVGVTPMAVSYWKVRGVPAHQVLSIESATGVPRHDLRPDIYPESGSTLNASLRSSPAADQSAENAGVLSSAGGAQ